MRQHDDTQIYAYSAAGEPFPIQDVVINWNALIGRRESVIRHAEKMPYYLLMPEVNKLIWAEKHPMYRLIMDVMWTTGAWVSEVLGITPDRMVDSGGEFGVLLRAKRQRAGRPTRFVSRRFCERYVPILDEGTKDRLQTYVCAGHFRSTQYLFTITPQTLNRRVHALAKVVNLPAHRISATTFRHSFAVNLIAHGYPLCAASKLLGHENLATTAIYETALAVSDREMLRRVQFH